MIQKSGYYARAAASNSQDLSLIKECADVAVQSALDSICGVVGHDEDQHNQLRAIEFPRIAGGKPFNINESWFNQLEDIGQQRALESKLNINNISKFEGFLMPLVNLIDENG